MGKAPFEFPQGRLRQAQGERIRGAGTGETPFEFPQGRLRQAQGERIGGTGTGETPFEFPQGRLRQAQASRGERPFDRLRANGVWSGEVGTRRW